MFRRRWTKLGPGVLVVCAVAVSGCLGRSAPVRFYTMSPIEGARITGEAGAVAFVVGPLRFPRYLERPQIVTRDGSELKFDDLNRWAGGFEGNVRDVLTENLRSRLGSDAMTEADATRDPEAVRVLVDVVAFEGNGSSELVLRARWSLRSDAGADRNWSEESTLRRPIEGRGLQGLITAHNQALAGLADAIAARIVNPGI